MGGEQVAPKGKYLLDVPTGRGLLAAIVAIVVFLAFAGVLYRAAGKHLDDFEVKVADFLLQGALISFLFAILKGIIDWLGERPPTV
jgi:hypothetical protein